MPLTKMAIALMKWACQHFDSPEEILEYLFAQVAQFSGADSNHGDDMTSIVMRITN